MRVTDYLNERYKIIQDTDLYRFTSDSLLLSRFPVAKKHEIIADFCAGSGVVGLNYYIKNGAKRVVFVEAQEALATMCEETIALNGAEDIFHVEHCPVQSLPSQYNEYFSLILCNPPYERGGFASANEREAACRKELTLTLKELCDAAKRCLKYGGRFVLCHRADRAAELCYTLHGASLEPKRIQFVSGRRGKKPYLVLIEAVKGGKAGVEVLCERENKEGEGE